MHSEYNEIFEIVGSKQNYTKGTLTICIILIIVAFAFLLPVRRSISNDRIVVYDKFVLIDSESLSKEIENSFYAQIVINGTTHLVEFKKIHKDEYQIILNDPSNNDSKDINIFYYVPLIFYMI